MSDEHDWEDGNFVEYAEPEMSNKLYTAADLEQTRADGLEKLRAFMTGLECENIDQFVGLASKEACSALGKLIKTIVRANERARCIHVAELERISPDETDGLLGDDDTAYNHCVDHVVGAIRALGPIGEPRKETEDLAFQTLGAHGVPRDRAGTVSNGIEVLVTRLNKAAISDREETERRVRREIVEKVKLMVAQKPNPDKNGCYITFDTLDAIAEGK